MSQPNNLWATRQLHEETVENTKIDIHEFSDLASSDINLQQNSIYHQYPWSHIKSKAYRCILELFFQIRLKQKLFKSVNTQNNKQAKIEAMVQLGLALWRLIATMSDHYEL